MTSRRLPAEWEPQSGILLTWPHEQSDWKPLLTDAQAVFVNITSEVSKHEKVLIVSHDSEHQRQIAAQLSTSDANGKNIHFASAPSNDTWARDHGPLTIIDHDKPALLDFQFNGWGGKHACQLDNLITTRLDEQNCFRCPVESVDFILEGGSIDTDGRGTLLTTRCLLTNSRNRGYSQDQIEQVLATTLGIRRVHWLSHGALQGDDTDAHIDTLARFVSPTQITYVKCDDPTDEHFIGLQQMEQELMQLRDGNNHPYQLIPLPLPDPVYNDDGRRLPATYANFLIVNDAVLIPVYGQNKDQTAIKIIKNCFPTRKIVAINCLTLVQQFGSLHCVTMQFPEGVLA